MGTTLAQAEPVELEDGPQDALGTVLALVDGSGNVTDTYTYDEYGVPLSSTGSSYNPRRFTGQQYDPETGFYYLRNRYYSPEQGRFVRRDPIGHAAGINLYGYANGNPLDRVDPTGLAAPLPHPSPSPTPPPSGTVQGSGKCAACYQDYYACIGLANQGTTVCAAACTVLVLGGFIGGAAAIVCGLVCGLSRFALGEFCESQLNKRLEREGCCPQENMGI